MESQIDPLRISGIMSPTRPIVLSGFIFFAGNNLGYLVGEGQSNSRIIIEKFKTASGTQLTPRRGAALQTQT